MIAGSFVYSFDGLVKDVYIDGPTVIISMSSSDMTLHVRQISENWLELPRTNSGYTDIKVRKGFQTEINGKQAYVVDPDVKINGRDALLHQTVIKGDTKIVVAQASIKSDYDSTLKEVKRFEKALRVKE